MLYAIIEHKNNTLIMEFPCRRMTMAEHLVSVGIRTPTHEIKCADEENILIKVKTFGESEFGKKLASVISEEDTLSLVNSFWEMYQNKPRQSEIVFADHTDGGIVMEEAHDSRRGRSDIR